MVLFFRKLLRKINSRIARKSILVLGDSHACVFDHDLFRLALPLTCFKVVAVHGATVSGLDNPNSKTQAQETFRRALQVAPVGSMVFTMLGEVDTGFVIWYRAAKYNQNVESMMKQAVENYLKFIQEVNDEREVVVVSTPLPTIADGEVYGDVANLRKDVSASQKERTVLTQRFNLAIRRQCISQGIPYLNLDSESLGDNGLVSPRLLHPDKNNHHYKPLAHARLLLPFLREIL